MWNRQRTDQDLVDPANTGLGHREVQRWNLPEGWVISARPAHPALVSEVDFIAVQDASAPRGPPASRYRGPAGRWYLLAGLLRCGTCGRRLESAWSNHRPAYRCRHSHTSAARLDPGRPKNLYIREDQVVPHLAALAILLAGQNQAQDHTRQGTAPVITPAGTAELIDHLRAAGVTLTYNPDERTLRTDTGDPIAVIIGHDR